jgi:hypothetical protein
MQQHPAEKAREQPAAADWAVGEQMWEGMTAVQTAKVNRTRQTAGARRSPTTCDKSSVL